MDQRTEYLIQILKTIGSPLMASIVEVAARSGDDAPQSDAKRMAELLSRTVQVSIDMANMSGLTAGGAPDDAVRVALAAVAGPLVAAQFRQSGKVPGDQDLRRLINALQAVLSFSENFTPGPEILDRLKTLEASGQGTDASQVSIQYLRAFVPVVNAISAFPFGQPEQKLVTEVAARLAQTASRLCASVLGPDEDRDDRKILELSILRDLALVYAACHENETARLMKAPEQSDLGMQALDSVWKAFDLRAGMLEVLVSSLLFGGAYAGTGRGSRNPAPPQPSSQAVSAPPPAAPSSPPAAPPLAAESSASAAAASPLSLFAKPKNPAQAAPAAAVMPPPPATPDAAPPEKPPVAPPGGSPMSFFKKE